jgi:hypothetical protein
MDIYRLLWGVGATCAGGHCGSEPQYTLHAGASGLQLHHPSGSIAIAVVAIAIPTPKVSNAVANLIIIRVSSLRDNESCKADLAEH